MSKKLVLIDGHSLAYRAFHALPATLATSQGELTNAVFGFTSMLLNVLRDEKPDYIAVAFDVGRTFRHEQYPQYKAHRAAMPDELRTQMARIRQVVEAFNIPVFEVEGYEADDVLGTLSRQAAVRGVDTLLVTGDTDAFQLVDPHIRVLTSRRSFSDTVVYDEAGIQARYGLRPQQLIDYKALTGDKSDNIPGVRGVGEKTATELLQTYGSVEGIYEHLDEITGRARSALEGNRDLALLSKQLAAIVRDVNIELDLESCRVQEFDRQRVAELFRELEFRTLLERLTPPAPPVQEEQLPLFAEAAEAQRAPIPDTQYQVITTETELHECLRLLQAANLLAFDVETTSTDPMLAELVGLALAWGEGQAVYIPLGHAGVEQLLLDMVLARLRPLLADASMPKAAHNGEYDLTVLARYGVTVQGELFDTMIAEWLLDPASRNLGLKNLAFARLGAEMTSIGQLIGTGSRQITMAQVPLSKAASYAAADVDMTWRLVGVLRPELEARGLLRLFQEVEMPLVPVLVAMQQAGVALDVGYLREMSKRLTARLVALEQQIHAQVGYPFNINSTQQLSEALFDRLQLPRQGVPKTSSGHYSTSANVLRGLRGKHPVIDLLLEQRELSKLKSTYVDALVELVNPRTGRVHTSYNQTGTVTGRLSSSNPNLQNIPIRTELGRQIRRAFVAQPGWKLLAADYSQVELRVMAHISQDPGLLAAFRRGEDIHASTAAAVLGVPLDQVTPEMRRLAKGVNFGIMYGQGPYGLAQQTGMSQEEATQFIRTYFATYPKVKEYVDRTRAQARQQGYVETLLGRRRYFPELGLRSKAHNNVRQAAERAAINMPIQGCLPYEARVLTSDGYCQIGELYRSNRADLRVWTGTAFAPFKVLNRGPCELAELILENGHVLRCDTRHETLVVTEEGYVWKSYRDLVEGDRICLTLPQEIEFGSPLAVDYKYTPGVHSGKALSISTLDELFFYWLGFYYGDGWFHHDPDDHRWRLTFCIGPKVGHFTASEKVAECVRYFEGLGLKANIRSHSPEVKKEVIIYSRGFVEFLERIGVATQVRAATKRVPEFVFCSSLAPRKAFLRGILDSDGYAGGEGASNPSIHLCQKPLLEDLWLLFRTVGVEGKLRGPYQYGDQVSYRLDLVGGMLERSLGFSGRTIIKVPNMAAPHFVVASFLENVSPSQLSKQSHKVIYNRLQHGGKTSIYTLAEMTKAAGASLSVPLYTWSALREKRSLGVVEETFTVMVDDPLHRFDSEGVISKNTAADIIKIAMIRLHQTLRERGLRSRMILQVHDELVLEVPDGELPTVAPLAREIMEGAFKLDAPLKADLKVGENWLEMEAR